MASREYKKWEEQYYNGYEDEEDEVELTKIKHSGICRTCKSLLEHNFCPMNELDDPETIELRSVHEVEYDDKNEIDWCPMHWDDKENPQDG